MFRIRKHVYKLGEIVLWSCKVHHSEVVGLEVQLLGFDFPSHETLPKVSFEVFRCIELGISGIENNICGKNLVIDLNEGFVCLISLDGLYFFCHSFPTEITDHFVQFLVKIDATNLPILQG